MSMSKKMIKIMTVMLIITGSQVVAAKKDEMHFYETRERGWYYFESLKQKQAKRMAEEQKQASEQNQVPILKQLEQVQQRLEVKKAKLVLEPSVENARDYMSYQKRVFANAAQVSKVWQEALIRYPELDPRIENPVDSQAIKIKYEEELEMQERKINEFAQHFKLILFYKADCQYCQAFKPVLKSFATKYNFKVTATSLDHNTINQLPEFPREQNTELTEELNIQGAPILIAVSHKHNLYIPVARGYMPEDQLMRNIVLVYDGITGDVSEKNDTSLHQISSSGNAGSVTHNHINLGE